MAIVENQGFVGGWTMKFLMMESPFLTAKGGVVCDTTSGADAVRVIVADANILFYFLNRIIPFLLLILLLPRLSFLIKEKMLLSPPALAVGEVSQKH